MLCDICASLILTGFIARLPDYEDDVSEEDSRWICEECKEDIEKLTFFRVEDGEIKEAVINQALPW